MIMFMFFTDPVWASVNLGIMLCINCSGEYLVFHCISLYLQCITFCFAGIRLIVLKVFKKWLNN